MNPTHVKQDREDLMADPLRALFTPESPDAPWWYPLWLRTLPLRWSWSRKSHPSACRAVLITDDDLMDAVIFDRPLSRKQRVMQVWSIAWRDDAIAAALKRILTGTPASRKYAKSLLARLCWDRAHQEIESVQA